mgnify:CR=1 FL=1
MTTETHTEGNSEFLKNWKNFQRHFKGAGSILLPISFDIKDGKIVRNRITAKELSSLRTELINDFEAHYKTVNDEIAEDYSVSEFKTMLDEYIKWFEVLFSQVSNSLYEEGIFIMEGHEDHLVELKEVCSKYEFETVEIIKDYTNRDRFLIAKK